ncbi:glucose-1-phosphate thymidylyltransferase [Methermicoccus shengliensis]|uniref:Glucose-1-phosphate thymidylyltransferase n=1 Tax=Methermicoccus shengliensis TaxID=660064 RepID=A0A832RTI9_9EURY|nr:glucose-1-phosphate thymidylyltransferase [Methermicoccus shengliensis]KUK04387.1 MAG: Glucose-1-phosphate thymidyltransferase [Euryarchaeota archaeon 55_53]KUK30198.1 MAG: Glucose-1-phosphate thymidyltransferase [Methanosarcinales archeaon 56_1174]MDI3488586.1 glucose-phosphate thymidylyltransferase [Methanosarcinales archaeon]MDN5295758.1 glucose-phosphate thymidylyltransferase [Methanosarcinales archaeon]HIH69037.1 glucose-1-phosphate thymidylyltransferase [Methermicoccus shengliensis]
MKALILSGGHGTRLRPLTYSQQKQLIPVANKPVLFYAIEDVIEAGIKDIGIIVGPNKEQVMETVNSVDWDAEIEFIYQGEPKGLAHAILVAEEFLDNEEFVMYLGDNILRGGIVDHANKFKELNPDSLILLTEVDEPQRFGVAELDENGRVKKLVEKPKVPPSNYALVGVYFFKPIIIEACKNIKPSWRNELEITDAIQWLIDNGYRVEASIVEGWWKDTGKPEDILEANRLILDDIQPKNEGKAENSRIMGRVVIESGTVIKDSVIKGPCVVGKNCRIVNSYIGPYTSIGNNCEIEGTEIEDSVIMDGSKIINAGRFVESLIGRNVKIQECNSKPRGYRFIVGDNSDIVL